MIDIFKVVGIAISGGVLSLFLKNYRKEYAIVCSLITAVVIFLSTAEILSDVVREFVYFTEKSGINKSYVEIVMKTIAISYIGEFGAGLLKDAGETAVAQKVELFGKVLILYLVFPVVAQFLEVCIDAVNSI